MRITANVATFLRTRKACAHRNPLLSALLIAVLAGCASESSDNSDGIDAAYIQGFFEELFTDAVIDPWFSVLLVDVQSSQPGFRAFTRNPCGPVATVGGTGVPTGDFSLQYSLDSCSLIQSTTGSGTLTLAGSTPTNQGNGVLRSSGDVSALFALDGAIEDAFDSCMLDGTWRFDFLGLDTSSALDDIVGMLEVNIACGNETRSCRIDFPSEDLACTNP